MELPFAISLDVGSSQANRTGSWRTNRPEYVHRLAPCNDACPAGEDIQAWLYQAEPGDYESAWRKLVEDNPFPAVMGRICYHPCETACNRAELDEAVGINSVERFLGDLAVERSWALPAAGPDTGKRVLVVGAGPAGLSATYHLRRLGHHVRLVDSAPMLGGMMRYGIPAYRLSRQVLDAEIERIVALGVDVELNHVVGEIEAERSEGRFDAVFLAVGAQLAKRIALPAGDSGRVIDAISLLRRVADDDPPLLGRRVVVYGGGDTAVDAARTAVRLGATDSVIVYRRNLERMPAHEDELEEALVEGVTTRWLSTVKTFDDGRIVLERMRLNGDGFPEPTGEFEDLGADSLVLALGQDTDVSLLDQTPAISVEDGVIEIRPTMMTGERGVFAGGDAVPSPRTATVAIGHGRRAARGIDAFLSGPRAPRSRPRRARVVRPAQHLVLLRRTTDAAARARTGTAPGHLRRGRRRTDRGECPVRGAPLPVLWELLRVRQLLRRLSRQRGEEARSRTGLRVRLRLLQGVRPLRPGMPLRGHRHGARTELMAGLGGPQPG